MGGCVRVATRAGREDWDLGSGRSSFLGTAGKETLEPRLKHPQLLCLISQLSEAQRRKLDGPSHTSNGGRVSTAQFSGSQSKPLFTMLSGQVMCTHRSAHTQMENQTREQSLTQGGQGSARWGEGPRKVPHASTASPASL